MSEIENKVTGEPTSSGEYYIEELVGRRCRVGEAFEKWFKTTMLPAECDDERVIVGLRLCWDAAIESIEAIPLRAMFDEGYAAGYRDGLLRQGVQGET